MPPAALLLCSVAFVGHGSNNATEISSPQAASPVNLSSDDAHGRLLALSDASRRRGRRSAERNGSRSLQATPRRPHERANATAAPHHHHREARWRVRTGRFARTPAGLALAVAPVAWDRPVGQQLGSEGSIALTNRPGLLRDLLLTAAFAVLGGFALMHCASRRSLRISWIYSSEGNTHALLRSNKMLLLLTINLTNLGCHSVFSILAAFFPQESKAKGATDEMVGLIFASFACVIFVASPMAARLMSQHGKSYVYIAGVVIVSLSTISFAVADALPAGWPFTGWCLLMRLVQGFGSALEETAAYALIADVDPERVSFLLGITEMSTGLGYMVGPPLGGWLFSIGGFRTPFLLLGVLLLPAAALIHQRVPPELCRQEALEKHEDGERDVPLGDLLRNPQILLIAVASVLANSDYAFLEPTLGDHAKALGIATSPDSIGLLFSVSSVCYTVSCPAIGLLSNRSRIGPRPMIYAGLLAQAIGFLLIGPSPLLGWLHGGSASWFQVIGGLVLFGVGESMSMTPVMDDMMHSCGTAASSCINALSSLMASAFSLGQMVGPLAGTALASHMGLPWAGTLMALLVCLQLFLMAAADLWLPHAGRLRGFMPLTQNAAATTELERFTSSGSSQSRHGTSAAISSGDEL